MVETLENTAVDALTLAPNNPLRYWRQLKAVRSLIDGLRAIPHAIRTDPNRDEPLVHALIETNPDLLKYRQSRFTPHSRAPFTERIPS
jgi:hypothetical protein